MAEKNKKPKMTLEEKELQKLEEEQEKQWKLIKRRELRRERKFKRELAKIDVKQHRTKEENSLLTSGAIGFGLIAIGLILHYSFLPAIGMTLVVIGAVILCVTFGIAVR